MSVATLSVWVAVYLVTQLFPILVEGSVHTYISWIFFAVSVMAAVFVWRMIPETKEKTLEEIEHSYNPDLRFFD